MTGGLWTATLRDLIIDRLGIRRHQEVVSLARKLDRLRIGSRTPRHRHRDLLPGQQRALEPHARAVLAGKRHD